MIGAMADTPTYHDWDAVPDGLRPAADLRFAGLEPRGEAVAYLAQGERRVALYRSADAVPRASRPNEAAPRGHHDPSRATPAIGSPGSTAGRSSRRVTTALPRAPRRADRATALEGRDANTDARGWLRALLLDDFVVLDTETTGLGYRDEVIEIGIVDPSGRVVFESLVRPQAGSVPAGATRVHGLTMRDLETAPCWRDVHDAVVSATRGRRVIAWNAPFDERMVRQSATRWGCSERLGGFECAMRAYAAVRGLRYGRAKLERAAAEMGVLPVGAQAHRSSDDARLTLQVLMRAATTLVTLGR